jgi:hypothetical protein
VAGAVIKATKFSTEFSVSRFQLSVRRGSA